MEKSMLNQERRPKCKEKLVEGLYSPLNVSKRLLDCRFIFCYA